MGRDRETRPLRDYVRSAEKPGQKRNQGGADQGNAAARHELLDALGLCLCVIKKQ